MMASLKGVTIFLLFLCLIVVYFQMNFKMMSVELLDRLESIF